MSFPAYESYKESGEDWIGLVPDHWSVSPVKASYSVFGGATPKSDVADYWDGDVPWITPADLSRLTSLFIGETIRTLTEEGLASCAATLVPAGSVILSTRAPIGSLGIAERPTTTNQGCKSLVPRSDGDAKFLAYVLSCAKEALNVKGKGTTFLELSGDELGRFHIPAPAHDEQCAIATFLDRETAKIDALVEAQERLIALLKEKRQAVISHAVTKGLDPSAPMKDSGVEWLGQVPAHWEVCSAKRVASVFVPQRNKPELNSDGLGIGWVTMDDMRQHDIRETHRWVSAEAAAVAGSSVLPAGSVIASCVGNFGVSSINRTQVIINQQLQAYIPSPSILAEWLAYSVRLGVGYFEQVATVATLPYVNQIGFGGLPLALPPLEEQRVILRNLEERVRSMGRLIEGAEAAVSLLNERRAALISAAVTGKIDVRGLVQTAEAA